MTHNELIPLAADWLKRCCNCVVVVTEMATGAMEEPDALGWTHWGVSYLVECKATRQDFLSDQKKPWRRDREWREALGRYRYYFAPKGILKEDELPEGWGLVEVHSSGLVRCTRKIEQPTVKVLDGKAEMIVLISCLRRIGQNCNQGVKVNFYSFDESYNKKPRATLGIMKVESDGNNQTAGLQAAEGI